MKILHVCANPKPTEESVSKQLAAAFFTKLAEISPDNEVSQIDLYENPPPYLSYEAIKGLWNPVLIDGYQPTNDELAALEYTDAQCALFNDTDVLVLTIPMWSFSVPAILKAWMEHVLAPGKTYTLAKTKVTPLHHVKKIVVLVSSGAHFKENDPRDALTIQIEAAFGQIGIDDFGIAWAEGQDPLQYTDAENQKQVALEAAVELAEDVAELSGTAAAV